MNEFQTYIKGIYGDAPLDQRTMMQLQNVWKTNPQAIINAYNQKNQPKKVDYQTPKFGTEMSMPTQINLNNKRENDDLSGITNFGDAFKVASQKNLKQFKWRSTNANPSGLFKVEPNNQNKQKPTQKPTQKPLNFQQTSINVELPSLNLLKSTRGKSFWDGTFFPVNRALARKAPSAVTQTSSNLKQNIPNSPLPRNKNAESQSRQSAFERMTYQNYRNNIPSANNNFKGGFNSITPSFYQQGGAMQGSSQEQELQKAFLAYLIQDAAQQGIQLQSEQDLQNYAQQLGEEGIRAKYQEFMQKMQGGVMAKLGTKLDYIKKLKGICPEGYELTYFKVGGRICKSCQKKHHTELAQEGKKLNAIEQFKKKKKEIRL